MLNVLRNNPSVKWVLWIVAISMTLYLGSYFFDDTSSGVGESWAARVDGEAIPTAKFNDAARRADDYYRQLMGERYEQIRPQLKLGSQVIQGLVDEKVQAREARKLGLGASPDEIVRFIQNDPRLKDPESGQFVGNERYKQAIGRTWPGGVSDFERAIGDSITVRKWMDLATEAVGVTDAEVEEAYSSTANRTKIDYVIVPSAGQAIDNDVPSTQARAHYASHQDDYKRGEARKVRFFVVERQAQISKVQVTDEDIRTYYEANQAQYQGPGGPAPLENVREMIRRQLELIRAQGQVRSEADRIRALITSPQDLDSVAQREGLKVQERLVARDERGGDLGASPAFLDAVFAVAPGAVSDPVALSSGIAILTPIGDAVPPAVRPFEEVADRVQSDILNLRTREAARKAATTALAKHKTLVDAAKSLGLEVKSDQSLAPGQPLPSSGGPSPELEKALFGAGASKGTIGVIPVPAGAVLYEIREVERFDPAVFAAKKQTLREELLAQKKTELLQGIMERLREKHQVEINHELVEAANQ